MKKIASLVMFIFVWMSTGSIAQSINEPVLTIKTSTTKKAITRSQLLKYKSMTHITMQNSRAYPGIKLNLTVVKFCDILKTIPLKKNAVIELVSSDDFVALIPANALMQCTNKTAVAYLAIETEQQPWPKLKYNNPDKNSPDDGTAGPFMVIWLHPEKSDISNEYWAWKLAAINVQSEADMKKYLAPPATKNARILNGYRAYVNNCLGCHTINHIGKGKIGPDLNAPVSVFKRFDDATLKKLVRDPQSVRAKNNDRMSGIDETVLSNKDLDDLILYLHYVSRRAH